MTTMRSNFVLSVLLLTCACSKSTPGSGQPMASSTSSAVSTTSPAPNAPSATAKLPDSQAAWYGGHWKGEFVAAKRQPGLSAKEGAPAAWDKDDGKRFAGPSTLEVNVDSSGNVTGRVTGALGDLAVRGKIDGDELRANLVPKTQDVATIQNGYVVLTHEADSLKGRLSAATGDALVMRHSEMTLKKDSQP